MQAPHIPHVNIGLAPDFHDQLDQLRDQSHERMLHTALPTPGSFAVEMARVGKELGQQGLVVAKAILHRGVHINVA